MVKGVVQSIENRGTTEGKCEVCSACAVEPGPVWLLGRNCCCATMLGLTPGDKIQMAGSVD
jgi:hypothetical protein